jgi:hypothetical protein
MRLGITSAVASALIGFICAAVPLAAAEAQAPAAAPAKQQITLTNAIDAAAANAFETKVKPGKPDPAAAAQGMAAAPAMIAAAGVECTPTEARMIGVADATEKGQKTTCKDNLGLILLQANDTKPSVADCLSATFAAKGRPSALTCILPANNNAPAALQPYLLRAHNDCAPVRAGYVGDVQTVLIYELQCQAGNGVILQIAKPKTAAAAAVSGSCFALQQGSEKPWPCKLTTQEANLAMVKALATKASPTCTPAKQRYVNGESDGSEYYEYSCANGAGLIVQADAKGNVLRTLTCGQAGGMCTMTTDAAGVAEAAKGLSDKVKAAGLTTCEVAKFKTLKLANGFTEATEVTCNSGPGGIFLTKDGKSTVFNCGRVMAEGYTCDLNGKDAANTAMTAQLKTFGKNSCVVNGVSPLASATSAYIEVACSDGAPGYMIKYPRASNEPAETYDVYTCANAKSVGGGCRLPTNKLG